MSQLHSSPQKIAVLANPVIADSLLLAEDVAEFLRAEGAEAAAGSLNDPDLRQAVQAQEFDALIALGGDGTMLRAGHLCAPAGIPLLGINVGHFGFLVEVKRESWRDMLPKLLSGDFRYEERMMILARCSRQGFEETAFDVINDVVVARGRHVRPIEVEADLEGARIARYSADGLIAATATGSTAYALAAGGPILPPESRNILLVPVAPHLSVDRAVVLAEGASICITVRTEHEAVVSVDGQEPLTMASGDCVQVRAHEKSLHMIRFQDPGYFYRNLTAYMEHNPLLSVKANGKFN
ncbi:NAD(+)/NADH kinase [Chloroflexota bacterium]|nr:NAD(+)/NADH kinase [Chloroflexota bacterium]